MSTVEPAGVKRYRTAGLGELPSCAHWGGPDVILASDYDALRQQLLDERKEIVKLEHWLLRKDEQLAEMRGLVEELRNDLINIIVGGCTCGTKPPDPALHELNCHYRMAEAGMARIAKCAALAPTSQPSRGKCGGSQRILIAHGAHPSGFDLEEVDCPGCVDCAQPERQGPPLPVSGSK